VLENFKEEVDLVYAGRKGAVSFEAANELAYRIVLEATYKPELVDPGEMAHRARVGKISACLLLLYR